MAAVARTVGHLSKSAEVMKLVNNLMKAPEIAVTMQEFSKEMTKVPFSFLFQSFLAAKESIGVGLIVNLFHEIIFKQRTFIFSGVSSHNFYGKDFHNTTWLA